MTVSAGGAAEGAAGVVIPVFNRPVQVVRALESVLAQSAPPVQVVVVDDGSSDGTGAAALEWAAARPLPFRFRLIRQENAGAAAARNAGFAALEGCGRVLFLDSDDRMAPDLLARAGVALDGDAGAVLALADIAQVTAEERVVKILRAEEIALAPLRYMFRFGSAFLSSSLIDVTMAARVGLFPAGYPTGQDTVFFCRLAMQGRWLPLPGAPSLMATYLAPGGAEAGHLSSRYPDRFLRWARMHGDLYRELAPGLGRAERAYLRRRLAGRYFNAAQYAWRAGRYADCVAPLGPMAWHWGMAGVLRLAGG